MRLLFGVSIFFIVSVLTNCSADDFNTEIARVHSPDAKYETVIFVRDVGATAGFSTQISIVKNGEKLPQESGNIFVSDDDHGKAAVDKDGSLAIKATWKSDTVLEIQFDKSIRTFKMLKEYSGITIIYVPVVDSELRK